MTIASKEARESKYWLELIQTSKIIDNNVLDLISLNNELIKLLNSIILTSKGKTRRK